MKRINKGFDGKTPIVLGGKPYAKGIGTCPPSEIVYKLNGQYERFLCDVGANNGSKSLTFTVYADNVKRYESGVLTRKSAIERINVDVKNVETLKLVAGDGGDGNAYDDAAWANAMLIRMKP